MPYNKHRINYFFQLPFGFFNRNEIKLLSNDAKIILLSVMELASNNKYYTCQYSIGLDAYKRLKADDLALLLNVDISIISELIEAQLIIVDSDNYCHCTYCAQFLGKENIATTRLREKKVKEQLTESEQNEAFDLIKKLYNPEKK